MTMTTERTANSDPITIPLQQLHMLLAGRIPLLQLCRDFGWADTEAEMINPFRDRNRDGFEIASVEITEADSSMPLVTFQFARPRP